MLKHGLGIPLEMLAVAKLVDVRFACETAKQELAFDERLAAKVATVEIKKVEDVVDKPLGSLPSQIGIQRFEIQVIAHLFASGVNAR